MSHEAQTGNSSKTPIYLLFILVLAAVLTIFSEIRASNNLIVEFSKLKEESALKSSIITYQSEIIRDQGLIILILEHQLEELQKAKSMNLAAFQPSY